MTASPTRAGLRYAPMDSQSAAFVDAVAAGLGGHPRRMQQMLERVLRRPPTALATNPPMLEGLHAAVASIKAPERAERVDSGAEPAGTVGRVLSTVPESELPGALDWDRAVSVRPALTGSAHEALSGVIEEYGSQSLKDLGILPTRTLLLTGAPGTGKTISARWIARRLDRPLLRLDLAAVMAHKLGMSAKNLVQALDWASETDAVLFIDEFDAVGSSRDSGSDIGEVRRLVNVLLLALESWPQNHLLIGATNHPELLDKAVHRRFELTVCLAMPDKAARERIWRDLVPTIGDAEQLAEATEGWSGSDIARCALRGRRRAGLLGDTPSVEYLLALIGEQQ